MAVSAQERKICNDSALECFGTAYIFEQRAAPLRIGIKVLTFSSLIGPLVIGALVLAVGTEGTIIIPAMIVATCLSVIQIITSLWALISKWQDNLIYYLESKAENYHFSNRFKKLANNTTYSDSKWREEYEVLEAIGVMRGQLDLRHDLTDEEKRMGMRASLRKFQRQCVGCKTIPTSMKSSNCDICGGYKKNKIKWLI